MGLSRCLLAIGVAATLALAPGSALAGEGVIIKTSKHKDGPYTTTEKRLSLGLGDVGFAYWRIKNTVQTRFDITLEDISEPNPGVAGYKTKWFRRSRNITSDVKHQGYDFELGELDSKTFRTRVETVEPGGFFCLGLRSTSTAAFHEEFFQVNSPPCQA